MSVVLLTDVQWQVTFKLMRIMKRTFLTTILFLNLALPMRAQLSGLEQWCRQPQGDVRLQKFAYKSLKREQVEKAQRLLVDEWLQRVGRESAMAWQQKEIRHGDLVMRFEYRILGEKPSDGRSLYISMHGGGATAPEVNDQQWRNQIGLYTPAEGVYVAPRAFVDDWDMWCKPGMDEFLADLIRMAVTHADVNPDKVYLMGYSAGGDGVWRMAPRMADTWAAASMMAGHPGITQQVNLRNTPYIIWMGALDAAYDRNALAVEKGAVMDSLRQHDPEGYVHETHIMEGMGHWMLRADSAAVPWMAQFRRNPFPDKIVWRQEEVTRPFFYWIGAPGNELIHGHRVDVSCEGNCIDIGRCDYSSLTFYLSDEMFDLDKPITVIYQGRKLVKCKVKRTIAEMYATLQSRGDQRYIFPAKIKVEIPKQNPSI